MKASIFLFDNENIIAAKGTDDLQPEGASLVLCFGAKQIIAKVETYPMLKKTFPNADIIMCSTAGEIFDTAVYDDTLSVSAMTFSSTKVILQSVKLNDYKNSFEAGKGLLQKFSGMHLNSLFVLSDGNHVNGSELSKAFAEEQMLVTGGLAGDGNDFRSTLVGMNGPAEEGVIVGVGFSGDKLRINHGTKGGWETFGLERIVTHSEGNVLFEIDQKNALDLYKRYLGPDSLHLPGAALLFPLAVELPGGGEVVVRTILSIDNERGSMTFAGDIPMGAKVRFMKANFDKITGAAAEAAQQAMKENKPPKIALLISCVGRKQMLLSRSEEELDAVDEVFRHKSLLTGFYSYGELSPLVKGGDCQLHNQTMTITTLDEDE